MVKEIPIRSALKSEKNGLKIMIITWLETIEKYLHVALKFKHFHISLYGAPPLKKYTVNVTTIKPSFKMFLVKLQKIICFQYIAL